MAINLSDKLWRYIAHDIAIDLGTANTLVHVMGKGVVIREPSTVAIHKKTKAILAVGTEARNMVGKTPASIIAVRPLHDGVISDFDVAEAMLKYFIRKVHTSHSLLDIKIPRPRVAIGIPSGVTEVERKAVVDAATRGGARKVYLIEEPMAAAIGANLPINEATGSMVVDIGGGTSEVAVVSLGGIVTSRSVRVAGDEFDEAIIEWVKVNHNILIGERTAEEAKMAIGSALPVEDGDVKEFNVRGRDLRTGLPKEITLTENDLAEALNTPLKLIVENIKDTVEETPPEILSDLFLQGLVLTGGGALIKRLDKRIADETKMPVMVDQDALTTVVRGCGMALENIDLLNKVKIA